MPSINPNIGDIYIYCGKLYLITAPHNREPQYWLCTELSAGQQQHLQVPHKTLAFARRATLQEVACARAREFIGVKDFATIAATLL